MKSIPEGQSWDNRFAAKHIQYKKKTDDEKK
jgi:hypothetical protein